MMQSKLIIDSQPLQVLPELAKRIGLNEAIVLQQVHYWLPRGGEERDGRKWIWKTYEDWRAEFPFWSVATIKRTVGKLIALRLLEQSKKTSTSWDRTNWYSINYAALNSLNSSIVANCDDASTQVAPMRDDASGQSATIHRRKLTRSIGAICTNDSKSETTSKITSETTAAARFDRFWKAYPRKVAKPIALRAWMKLKPDDALTDVLIAAIDSARATDQWCKDDGQFIPHPATWLNQRRWEDLPPEPLGPAGAPWWKTSTGIEEKGRALGIAEGDKGFQDFRCRVYVAAGEGPWNEAQTASRVVNEAQQRASA